MEKGLYLVISGPSGVGKDTVAKKLGGWISVSATSRGIREGEEEGVNYFYHSKEEMEALIARGELLEYTLYNGEYYGTPLQPIRDHFANGELVILVIEVEGAANVKKAIPDAVTVFIMPPSMEELRERLINRKTETAEQVEGRMQIAVREMEIGKTEYDYIVVNQEIEQAVSDILKIVEEEKKRR
ncbi:MAG: guanylate kinase [Clostridia bacterium]|nr:guanylate kinase [Clostridia bacterium]